jgi:hypothetical protein
MVERALIEVRVFPWRPRARVMKASTPRDLALNADPVNVDYISGCVVVLGVWLAILIAAPLVVLLLAGALFSVELPLPIGFGVLLILWRFAGLMPWRIVILNQLSGEERIETTRSLTRAIRRVREINGERRVYARWACC